MILLLDVMDTLVRDPFRDLPGFFGLEWAELLAQKHPRAWIDFELGAIDEPTFLARFFTDGRPVDGPGLKAFMRERYEWLEGIPALLDELRAAGVPAHALTNYPPWTALLDEKLGLSARVPLTFASWRTGVRKPDRAAFEGAARALGVAPGECLVVDDRPANCDGARAAGMQAHRFASAAALRADLRARRLLP